MSLLRVELGREAGGPWLRLGATRLQPDERLARMLDSVREQHLKIALPADDISLSHPGEAQTILATVQAHEWVGRELHQEEPREMYPYDYSYYDNDDNEPAYDYQYWNDSAVPAQSEFRAARQLQRPNCGSDQLRQSPADWITEWR